MFEVIGHRGAGKLLPENTMDGFKLAFDLGCPVIELDIHLTGDGRAAVIHNPVLEPTTDGTGLVGNYSMEELKGYDAGGGRTIPSLEEVLLFFKDTPLRFQIELKGEGTEEIVPGIVEGINIESRVRYTSFVHARVRRAVQGRKSSGGLLMCAWPIDPVQLLEKAGAEMLHLNRHVITSEIVELLHSRGKKIIAWDSIVEKNIFESLISMGVDGATTDRPDLFLDFLT